MDLPAAASFAAAASVLTLGGGWLSQRLLSDLMPFVTHPDAITCKAAARWR